MMFDGLKKPRNITSYRLMKGVADFGNLYQFDQYESGYSLLVVLDTPLFVQKLAKTNTDVQTLLDNYIHILENEFKGLDGLDNITIDPLEITNGIDTVSMIGKVNQPAQTNVSMRFFEKSGSTITKFHELFLKGIRDPHSQAKTYYNLLESADTYLEPGYENEVFTLLYLVTDNTYRNLEKAYLFLNAQPTTAETSIYNSERGQIENKELSVEYTVFAISTERVYKEAKDVLAWMHNPKNTTHSRLYLNSENFQYSGIDAIGKRKEPQSI